MKIENYQDLLKTRREFKDTKNEARELELNPGGPISDELQSVIDYSEGTLEVFLNQHKDFINSKLAKFGDFLDEISLEGRSAESTLKEILENTLRGAVIQQFKILKRKIGSDPKSLPKNKGQKASFLKQENEMIANLIKKDLNKTIKALLIEYYLALRICQKSNQNPNYTRKLLGNLHKVNAEVLLRLISTFKDTVIPLTYLKDAAIQYRDPEGFVRNTLNNFDYLKDKYSQRYPYISDRFLLPICRNKNPEAMLQEYIRRIEETKKNYPKVPIYILTTLISGNPNDFESRVVQFIKNTKIIEERYPFLIEKAKAEFGKKIISEKALIVEIEKYLSICEELEQMFPGVSYFIRRKALNRTKEELIRDLNAYKKDADMVINDPRIKDFIRVKPSILVFIYFSYDKENFLENCLSIQETYIKLQDYFYNIIRDPVFIEIRNKFQSDLINIRYISPIKSFEENLEFFKAKLDKFKSLSQKFDNYGKYKKNSGEGYISFLIEAIYYSDPEKFLISHGFEI